MNSIKVESPFDGKVLGEIALSNKEDIDLALDRARAVYENQDMWLPKYERVAILEKTVEIMNSRIEELTLIAGCKRRG